MTTPKKCWRFITNNGGWKVIAVLMAVAGFFARDGYTRLWEGQAQLETKHSVIRELVNSHDTDIGIIRSEMVHWTNAVNENTAVLRELGETILELRLEIAKGRP